MIPTNFEGSNRTFVGPPNTDIKDLPVYQNETCIWSCWEVTDEDLERIKESRRVWLHLQCPFVPPLAVTTENPFQAEDEWPKTIEENNDAVRNED